MYAFLFFVTTETLLAELVSQDVVYLAGGDLITLLILSPLGSNWNSFAPLSITNEAFVTVSHSNLA